MDKPKNEPSFAARRLKSLREARGLSQDQLAEMMDTTRNQLGKLERGDRGFEMDWIKRAAVALGEPISAFLEDVLLSSPGTGAGQTLELPAPDASYPLPMEIPRRTLPLRGQAAGGMNEDGKFILNGNELAEVLALPSLERVKDAYAVFMYGDSMEPAFHAGDTLFIDPSAPVLLKDACLVQLQGEEGDPPYGYVKFFAGKTSTRLKLRQSNPPPGQPEFLEFPLERVVSVHRVAGSLRR